MSRGRNKPGKTTRSSGTYEQTGPRGGVRLVEKQIYNAAKPIHLPKSPTRHGEKINFTEAPLSIGCLNFYFRVQKYTTS